MAVYTYEDVNPTLIANTTMQKRFINGVHKQYLINANEGYILHDKGYDSPVYDEITGEETGEVILGFRPPSSTATVAASYDFTANPREFYAILEDDLPEGAVIYSNNNHEVM
jgi:hypothetical protein